MNANLPRMGAMAAMAAALVAVVAALLPAPEAAPVPPKAEPDYFAFVRSMEGTRPDGILTQSQGKLVVDEELGHLFDYYLSALGEKNLDAIRAEIGRDLARRLPPPAAAEAQRLLDRYIAYKRALADVERGLPRPADAASGARSRLQAMQRLRGQYFSPEESKGLFAASDAYAMDTIARLEISADGKLDAAQRHAKLAALDAKLPPALREQRDAPTRVIRLEEAVQQLRADGGGDNEVYRLRAATLSPEAASRLADLDREEADWKRRIAAYQAERRQQNASGAGEEARQALRDTYFSAQEQKRLAAYE